MDTAIINKFVKYVIFSLCVFFFTRCVPNKCLSIKEIIKMGIINSCVFVVLDLLFPTVYIVHNDKNNI